MDQVYEMYELNENSCGDLPQIDKLIIAANSNKRCYIVYEKLIQMNIKLRSFLIFNYNKLTPTEASDSKIYFSYKSIKDKTVYHCERYDDDVIQLSRTEFKKNEVVGIDITGFTIPDLFRIFYVLVRIHKISKIYVFYTEPKDYYYKSGIYDTYEFLGGERTYRPIPEFYTSGTSQKEILVCFLGFDRLVSKELLERVNPEDSIIVNGFPSYHPKMKDISLVNNFDLVSTYPENVVCARANNPFSVYNALEGIEKRFENKILNICVLGTKPMALGACIFSLNSSHKVKVTYPYPQDYIKKTAEDSGRSWCYIIDF